MYICDISKITLKATYHNIEMPTSSDQDESTTVPSGPEELFVGLQVLEHPCGSSGRKASEIHDGCQSQEILGHKFNGRN